MTSMRVIRHTINHLGVVAASKLMPLASLLIYSRFLEPAEYGIVSLFVSYIWIFGIVMSLNLHTAIGRFIYDKRSDASELIGTTLLPIGIIFFIGICAAVWNLDQVARLLNLPRSTIPLLFAMAMGQIAESLLIQILTARERSGTLFAAIALRAIASLTSTLILFHALSSERYLAVLWAESATNALFTGYLLLVLSTDRPWSFSLSRFRSFASYSLPLIPYMLSLTLISQFDRVMLDRAFGKEITGVFSIGYNLGIILVMVAGALLNALNPRFFSAMDGQRYDDVCRDAHALFAVSACCAFGLALFGPDIAGLLIPRQYAQGFALIPLIAIGGLLSVIFQMWARVVFYTKRTYQLSIIAVSAVVLKVGLNLVLIPVLGFWGAALTTLLAYGLMAAAVVALINVNLKLFYVSITQEIVWLLCLGFVVAMKGFFGFQGYFSTALDVAVMLIAIGIAVRAVRPCVRPSTSRVITP